MPMGSYNGLPLDDDILDRIMTFCPTFGTLQSTILVSKAISPRVPGPSKGKSDSEYISSAGPALPQAMRVVRYSYDGYTSDGDPSTMAEACPEDRDPNVITAEEKGTLQENTQVVAVLEDIYSLTNKDRTSKTSVLTSEESWRFRRAMYRIMLYCHLFPGDRYSEEMDDDEELIDKIRKQRTVILSEYPTDDLRELHSAVKILRSVFYSVSNAQSNVTEALLSTGPSGALRAWQDRSYHVLEDDIDFMFLEDNEEIPLFARYISLPLENIWTARNITPPKEDDAASTWILDQVNGANDTCSHYATPGGLKLYTSASEQPAFFLRLAHPLTPYEDWDRFPVILNNLLKKNLKLNQTVAQSFYAATAHIINSDALGPFLGDLFAFKIHTAPVFDNWDRTDSYCFICFTQFLEEHLWIWFLKERIKGGWTPPSPEDCWYGWNCVTQVHRPSHAETKNHLCIPTKGNPD
ncbi:hypothetical protein GGX14DRAFT_651620 [Mycena pura]|uniref:Uncharacterized protein n=1 Tax=Mycena pura TaxID=153505 RepID=A0AAD6YB75_9AGAR|nr:hypothetical protein GGX14DRAFT_651620 [Mycena pura]